MITYNWRPPSLSELTQIISNMELTYLDSVAFIFIIYLLFIKGSRSIYDKQVKNIDMFIQIDQNAKVLMH